MLGTLPNVVCVAPLKLLLHPVQIAHDAIFDLVVKLGEERVRRLAEDNFEREQQGGARVGPTVLKARDVLSRRGTEQGGKLALRERPAFAHHAQIARKK